MCIAILNNSNTLPESTFVNSWQNNPDGGGFAYYDGKKIRIVKEMNSAKKLYQKYKRCRAGNKHPFIIHFRITTHGLVNLTNCHPFRISETAAFIHNGIIAKTAYEGNNSDTWNFNEYIMKELPEGLLQSDVITELLSEYIGYSKIVTLVKGKATIINEHLGTWDGGNWYSNDSYKESKPATCHIGLTKKYDYWKGTECDCCGYASAKYDAATNSYLCDECVKYFSPKYNRDARYY